MSSLETLGGADALSRQARQTARLVNRHQAVMQVRVSAVDIEADVAVAKIDALTEATGFGMQAVVRVARAQTQLEQLAPEASARLSYIAESHTFAVGDVLNDVRRDVRRK